MTIYILPYIDINTVGIMSAKKISKQFVKWCIGCLILKANASNIGMYVLAKMMVLPTKKRTPKIPKHRQCNGISLRHY